MNKVFELWNEYDERFPSDANDIGLLLNSAGLDGAIKLLETALKRGKRIEFTDAGDTDMNAPFIAGETI